jgi:ribosomal protein S25
MLNYEANDEAIRRVQEIDEKIKEENEKEIADGSVTTRLMFEQMLRGLYINNF